MIYFLYLLLPLLLPVALIALVWLCVRSAAQEKELKRLRQDLDALSAGMYGRELDFSATPPAAPTPTPTPAPTVVASAAAPAHPYAPPVRQTPPQANIPVRPAAQTAKAPEKPPRTLENWLGRNVMGIAASVLVFVGLIFLGVLFYKNITDDIKILLMYSLSALLTGLGAFLAARNRNNFTLTLTGCGCGSFFISILLTHVYFGRLPDLAAFGLLLFWMGATLFVARWQRSTLLSVVAHAGMIISLCFAFAQGISDEKLWLVLLYQAAASAVMLAGNLFCCRKTYHFGLFASLGLTLIASQFMNARFVLLGLEVPFRTSLPVPAIAAAFMLQFLMASVFSYLLAISASRLKNEGAKIGLHFLNKMLWVAALCSNVYVVAYRLARPHFVTIYHTPLDDTPAIGIAILVCSIPLLLHVALSLAMQVKLRFSKALECISVLTCFSVLAGFLLIFWANRRIDELPRLPWLILPALALFLVRRFSRQNAYLIGANILLGLDFLFAIFGGYGRLVAFGTPVMALEWMLLYAIIIAGQWFLQPPAAQRRTSVLTRILLYVVVLLSLIVILCKTAMPYPGAVILSILTGLHLLLLLLRYDREAQGNALEWVLGAFSLQLLAVDAGFIAFAERRTPVESGLYVLLTVLAFFLTASRAPRLFSCKNRPFQGVFTGIFFTLLVLAAVEGNTNWFAQSYILSLTCMLTALVCIAAGFIGRVSPLRFYGLILTLLCVLKLVTLDVVGLSTLLRVISLIGGGVICFIVSAMYHYTVKHFSAPKEKPTDSSNDNGPS